MIHNIEERQKPHERRFPASGRLGEEELARLIAQVEEREMLHAPVHVKENVFRQVRRQRRAAQRLQLFSYRAKVLVGMAAALAVLFLVPVGERETQEPLRSGAFERIFRQEQEDVDEIQQGALDRQRQIELTWQRYQEAQAREDAREEYFTGIESKFQDLRNSIF